MSDERKTIALEGFLMGDSRTWRMDISRALDGDERSSMVPLFEVCEREFETLCTWDHGFTGEEGRHKQFGAFRITIEPLDHPRNERYRQLGARRELDGLEAPLE